MGLRNTRKSFVSISSFTPKCQGNLLPLFMLTEHDEIKGIVYWEKRYKLMKVLVVIVD